MWTPSPAASICSARTRTGSRASVGRNTPFLRSAVCLRSSPTAISSTARSSGASPPSPDAAGQRRSSRSCAPRRRWKSCGKQSWTPRVLRTIPKRRGASITKTCTSAVPISTASASASCTTPPRTARFSRSGSSRRDVSAPDVRRRSRGLRSIPTFPRRNASSRPNAARRTASSTVPSRLRGKATSSTASGSNSRAAGSWTAARR